VCALRKGETQREKESKKIMFNYLQLNKKLKKKKEEKKEMHQK
jgi:hypothetical protein